MNRKQEDWESWHWVRNERIGIGTTLKSGDVRWVLMRAEYRLTAPTLLDRLRRALRWRHRFTAARITK